MPVLGLLGILEAGRSITPPLSIGGDWTVELDPAGNCASGRTALRQPGLSISQSGTEALITVNDGRPAAMEATVEAATLTAKSLNAVIAGKPGARTLEGKLDFGGCEAVAFKAVRLAPKKRT